MIRNFLQECDYNNGYKKAISDIKNWFDMHSSSLKYYKCYNEKSIYAILSAMEQNSDIMQQYADFTEFIIYKDKKNIKIELGEQNEI